MFFAISARRRNLHPCLEGESKNTTGLGARMGGRLSGHPVKRRKLLANEACRPALGLDLFDPAVNTTVCIDAAAWLGAHNTSLVTPAVIDQLGDLDRRNTAVAKLFPPPCGLGGIPRILAVNDGGHDIANALHLLPPRLSISTIERQ